MRKMASLPVVPRSSVDPRPEIMDCRRTPSMPITGSMRSGIMQLPNGLKLGSG